MDLSARLSTHGDFAKNCKIWSQLFDPKLADYIYCNMLVKIVRFTSIYKPDVSNEALQDLLIDILGYSLLASAELKHMPFFTNRAITPGLLCFTFPDYSELASVIYSSMPELYEIAVQRTIDGAKHGDLASLNHIVKSLIQLTGFKQLGDVMMLVKLARLSVGTEKADTYYDIAGYATCMLGVLNEN
jgi:hypothetical protein